MTGFMTPKYSMLLFVFVALTMTTSAQNAQEKAERKLSLQVDNLNFFRNNEFFSGLTEGYTLLGFHITPTVRYHLRDKLTVKGGLHALKYSGRENFRKVSPYFGLQYRFSPGFSMTIGSHSIKNRHRLVNPIFSVERKIDAYVENGLNFLYSKPDFYGNIWLDWEQFIYRNDPFREKFTAGGSFDWRVTSAASKVKLSIPMQFLVRHKGGQINDTGLPTTSVFNYTSGAKLGYSFSHSFIRQAGINFLYLGYRELSDKDINLYKNGKALYPLAEARSEYSRLRIGYWHARKFYAPLGHPMFQNIAKEDATSGKKKRRMLTAGFRYRRQVLEGVVISVDWDNYINTGNGDWNYTYALSVSFQEEFFLKKLQKP
ncbi:MAG: hypothetical protein K9J27_05410 [Bacteroidales bacterium]|nr:hypothetical protein [Bacteroidales bacterium]MCF8333357.1 hypothetical protein [Bacteroidales bacterium]